MSQVKLKPSASPVPAYQKLENRFTELADVERILDLLGWDRAVKMPASGAKARAEQYSTLTKIKHQQLTMDDMSELLEEAEQGFETLTEWEQANLLQMRRHYTQSTALPEDLLQSLTYTATRCETMWETARIENDFQAVLPLFDELLNLTRQKAKALADASKTETTPYDVMLDQYNAGSRYADIQPIFNELENWLPNFVEEVLKTQPNIIPTNRKFPIHEQVSLSTWLVKKIGFCGRLDTSAHPFSTGRINDVRITTRYHEDDFILYAVLCALHEAGHGLYDMQLPVEWRRQPVGGSMDISMAIHESQSMIWEMQIGHTAEFWNFIAPKCREIFNIDQNNPAFTPQNLCAASNHVERGFIRVDADETTYPLHILLRTKLEKAMIDGDLLPKDLPSAWNEEMQRLLGITPPTNKLGCLQDPHWYSGAFGYFPTYLLGAMNAAQIFHAMDNTITDLSTSIENGEFSSVRDWLKNNVHKHGCRYSPKELIRVATGKFLQIDTYKNHLKKRYLKG